MTSPPCFTRFDIKIPYCLNSKFVKKSSLFVAKRKFNLTLWRSSFRKNNIKQSICEKNALHIYSHIFKWTGISRGKNSVVFSILYYPLLRMNTEFYGQMGVNQRIRFTYWKTQTRKKFIHFDKDTFIFTANFEHT